MSLGRQRLSQAAVLSADGRDQQRKQLVKDFIHAGPGRLASGPFDSVALSVSLGPRGFPSSSSNRNQTPTMAHLSPARASEFGLNGTCRVATDLLLGRLECET